MYFFLVFKSGWILIFLWVIIVDLCIIFIVCWIVIVFNVMFYVGFDIVGGVCVVISIFFVIFLNM